MSKKEKVIIHNGMEIKKSTGDKVFDAVNAIILIALCFVTLYPMWYVLCASFTENSYLVDVDGKKVSVFLAISPTMDIQIIGGIDRIIL